MKAEEGFKAPKRLFLYVFYKTSLLVIVLINILVYNVEIEIYDLL